MATKLLTGVLMFTILSLYVERTQTTIVKYYCLPSQVSGSEFQFVVRLDRESDTAITGITAVNASVTPTSDTTPSVSSCVTTTEESSDVFALSQDIDADSLTCGIVSGGGTVYSIQILATGTKEYYIFNCDTTALLPSTLSVNNFNTDGMTNVIYHRENPYGVKFQAFHADGSNAPARSVDLGEDIILRLIYDTGHHGNDADNWGMVFHTGFIKHAADATTKLQIVTEGLGTKVHITGSLASMNIDKWVYIKRNLVAEFELPFVDYHRTASGKKDWEIETRGIKIESLHDKIGVFVTTVETDNADQFVVLPDDVLSTQYRAFQSNAGGSVEKNQEVVVVATEDATDVTITYNNFQKPGSLKVDGTNIGGGTPSTTVTLDEYDVLHIMCNNECAELELVGTENIAVVSGWMNKGHEDNTDSKGFSSTQVIPNKYYGTDYVLVESLLGVTGYFFQNDDPTDTTVSVSDYSRDSVSIGSPFYQDWNGEGESEVAFGEPVSVYMHASATSSGTPALIQYPSVAQWGVYYSFPVTEGISYYITIVTTKGDTAGIKVRFGGVTTTFTAATLGAGSGFAGKLQDVSRLASVGGSAKYEVYNNVGGDFDVLDTNPDTTERGLVELTASQTWKPFMLLVYTVDGDAMAMHLPIGVRYPPQNPCTATLGRSGDNIDNDCDGMVDEEIPNGVDDGDPDNTVDEDTALHSNTPGFRGIYVTSLIVDDTASFSTATTVHASGCNVITPDTKELANIMPFARNTDLDSVFDRLWVIDTPVFNAFRFLGKQTVYFRVNCNFCVGDLTLCNNSCQSSRKRKRSIEDVDQSIDLMLEVRGNETDIHIIDSNMDVGLHTRTTVSETLREETCSTSIIVWLPATLLLTTLIFQAVMASVFMHTRSKFIE